MPSLRIRTAEWGGALRRCEDDTELLTGERVDRMVSVEVLSVHLSLRVELIDDPFFLPGGQLPDEEFLPRRRKLATTDQVNGSIGGFYSLGRIYNDVVNLRLSSLYARRSWYCGPAVAWDSIGSFSSEQASRGPGCRGGRPVEIDYSRSWNGYASTISETSLAGCLSMRTSARRSGRAGRRLGGLVM